MTTTKKASTEADATPAKDASVTSKPDASGGPTTDASVNAQIKDPSGGVTMSDVEPLNNMRTAEQDATDAARAQVTDPDAEPFISEGMRHDLELYGQVNDPLTGRRITMDRDSGKTTVHPR